MARFSILAIALAITTSASAAEDPLTGNLVATPVGNWALKADEYQCSLSREFDAAGTPVHFTLTRVGLEPISWTRIAVPAKLKKLESADDTRVWVDDAQTGEKIHYNAKPAGDLVIREYMTDYEDQQLGGVRSSLRFSTKDHGTVEVRADDFKAGIAALNGCMFRMRSGLGITPELLSRMATPPEGNFFKFVHRPGVGYDLTAIYWVNEQGRVDECRLLSPTGIKDFDKHFCESLMKKGQYKPAQDVDGNPMRAPVFEDVKIRVSIIPLTDLVR